MYECYLAISEYCCGLMDAGESYPKVPAHADLSHMFPSLLSRVIMNDMRVNHLLSFYHPYDSMRSRKPC